MKKNKDWFTLIELIVAMTIFSILWWIWATFLNSIKMQWKITESNSTAQQIETDIRSLKLSNFWIYNSDKDDKINEINNLDNSSLTQVDYFLEVIRPVLWNNDYSSPKIYKSIEDLNSSWDIWGINLWIQKCVLRFHTRWDLFNSKTFTELCDKPVFWGDNLQLQAFLLHNESTTWVYSNWTYVNSSDYTWLKLDVEVGDNLKVKESELVNTSWGDEYWDILLDSYEDFFSSQFVIFNIPNYSWSPIYSVYSWNLEDFWNMIYDEYIPWVLNSSILNSNDIQDDNYQRKILLSNTYSNISLLYNNPSLLVANEMYLRPINLKD